MENIIYSSHPIKSFYKFGASKGFLEGEHIVYTKKKLWFFDHNFSLSSPFGWLGKLLRGSIKKIGASKVIYFDTSQGMFGTNVTFGYKAGGGDDSEINLTLSSTNIEILKEFISERGGVIGSQLEGDTFKTLFPFFQPKRWLSYREKITVGEDGIGHTRKSWFKTRNSYMEYESIKVFSVYGGLFSKHIVLLGDVTITTIEGLSPMNIKLVKDKLEKFNLTKQNGKYYKPALLSGKRKLINSPSYLLTDEGVFCKVKKEIKYLPYKNINSFHKCSKKGHEEKGLFFKKCKGWKELFAPIVISGTRTDARKGEGGNIHMSVPGIAFYRWRTLLLFNGSLKRKLMNNCK